MQFTYSNILESLVQKKNLTEQESLWLMEQTMSGNLSPVQIGAWLVAIRLKGETADEISSFARIMREKAVPVPNLSQPLIDTCGTGGDKSSLINVSTLAALVLASMNIKIAKHGNRAVSSKSGSADLLEKLGYPLNESPQEVSNRITNKNFGFLFAPSFHPAMKFAGPVRKELGIRTVFNILGPLANPAKAQIHLMGVFNKELLQTMGSCMKKLGVTTALIVHSDDGLDEISPIARTNYVLIDRDNMETGIIDPAPFALKIKSLEEIILKESDDTLQRSLNILKGKERAATEVIALNVTAVLFLNDLYHNRTKQSIQTYLNHRIPEIIQYIESNPVNLDSIF